jgi:deoxyribose-phosphate aldolase
MNPTVKSFFRGKVLNDDWAYASTEIREVNQLVTGHWGIVKVIFENDYLDDKHIIKLCEICSEHSVAFAKTSTGYGFVKQPNACTLIMARPIII